MLQKESILKLTKQAMKDYFKYVKGNVNGTRLYEYHPHCKGKSIVNASILMQVISFHQFTHDTNDSDKSKRYFIATGLEPTTT